MNKAAKKFIKKYSEIKNRHLWNDSNEYTHMWILDLLDFKHGGYFVEAGAAGKSDCYILERLYGWNGISVEPHTKSYESLTKKRKNTINKCLLDRDGTVDFYECYGHVADKITKTGEKLKSDQLSCIPDYIQEWHKEDVLEHGNLITKQAVTLKTLLIQQNAPKLVDLLVLDIEGAEDAVVPSIPFEDFKFSAITIENGNRFKDFLKTKGYTVVENRFKENGYDTHFVHKDML